MPFRRVVNVNEEHQPTIEVAADLAEKLVPCIAKVDLVVVRRHRSGRKTPSPVGTPIEVRYDNEDVAAFTRELADEALSIAIEDAGDRRHRYQFVALAEPLPGKLGAELVVCDAWVGDEHDEASPSREGEIVQVLRTARDLAQGVSAEFIKLLAVTNKTIEAVAKNITPNDPHEALRLEIARDAIRFDKDVAAGRIVADVEKSRARSKMWASIIHDIVPFGESILAAHQGAKKNPPTPAEISAVFVDHADLRDIFLAYLRTQDAMEKAALAERGKTIWSGLSQQQQSQVMMIAFQKLGEARAKELAAWVGLVFEGKAA